jgi:uncharacterized protein
VKLLDVNVVLAAHRDDHPHFATAREWLDELLRTRSPFSVIDIVAVTFLRIATNRRIFSVPTGVEDAFAYLHALRSQPGHALLGPGLSHLAVLQTLCESLDVSGDLIPDAQLAAIATEHACELVSFDRDFARFPYLRWVRPT